MLELRRVSAWYGKARALTDIDMVVKSGRIVTVIGANGAGKTTLVNSIMGAVPRVVGTVALDGVEIQRQPAHKRIRRGISLVPEGRRVFATLTVAENLRLGVYSIRVDRAELERRLNEMYGLFPRLRERRDQPAGTLSGGEQQMLAISRALMSEPRLLLLDEPSLGLAPMIIDGIFEALQHINRDRGLTLLLIEQNASEALELADDAFVLVGGRIELSGAAHELAANPAVRAAYLSVGGANSVEHEDLPNV